MTKEKGKAELVTKKESEMLSPLGDTQHYFNEMWHHPFALFRNPMWSQASFSGREIVAPIVDIFEEGKEVVVKAEIPGMKKSDINIDINGNNMTISGEKKQEKKVDRKDYHRVECSYGSFCRSFRLPDTVNSDKAKASFKNGVLEIRMPKSGKEKKKKITIS